MVLKARNGAEMFDGNNFLIVMYRSVYTFVRYFPLFVLIG